VKETIRLNGVIAALEKGLPAFTAFCAPETGVAHALSASQYDGLIFDMEHMPFDAERLRDCLQYLLNRRQILERGTLAPAVTPLVRIPANGGEMNQWLIKQVLDLGVYGVVCPHIDTVEEARSAVAACRYARPMSSPHFEPTGHRGDGPRTAMAYWGLSQQDYYARADVWPLNPKGEILVAIQCESVTGMRNLPAILTEVPGIGMVIIGEGDLSQDLGHPRQTDHPVVAAAIDDILVICKDHGVVCGHPHANADNIESLIGKGFRSLSVAPVLSFAGLEKGLAASGRA